VKKTLGIAAILLVTATASASVRVFVTSSADPYGLTIPANHNQPTFSDVDAVGNNLNAYDYYNGSFVCAAYPPIDAPSGTDLVPVQISPGDFAYIWLQFRDEPKGAKINGLKVQIFGPGGFTPTYYVQNDMLGNIAQKRWDGTATPPGYPEWHNNPQTMVAITAKGIVNGNDDDAMMFDNQSGTNPRTGVALLGAIDFTEAGIYHMNIIDISYGTPPNPLVNGAVFGYDIPEPASVLLLGVASLLIRRR
jgi:hypothetical protein